jgi:hypothetical protein
MDEKRISLKIDVHNGLIELDSPAEEFEQAISKTMTLTSTLDFGRPRVEDAPAASPEPLPPEATVQAAAGQIPPNARPSRGNSKGSAGRPGRIGSFEEVKGLLSEPQEKELRAFFSEKAPQEQGHRILVALVKGEQMLGRRGFSYNEIYTLMRLGGVKPLPKAVDVVLARLMQDQFVVRDGGGFAAKFLGREFVEDQLPPKVSNGG